MSHNLRSINSNSRCQMSLREPQTLIAITAFRNKQINENRKLETIADYKWQLSHFRVPI